MTSTRVEVFILVFKDVTEMDNNNIKLWKLWVSKTRDACFSNKSLNLQYRKTSYKYYIKIHKKAILLLWNSLRHYQLYSYNDPIERLLNFRKCSWRPAIANPGKPFQYHWQEKPVTILSGLQWNTPRETAFENKGRIDEWLGSWHTRDSYTALTRSKRK